jgi:hypothetical protein
MNVCPFSTLFQTAALEPCNSIFSPPIRWPCPSREIQLHRQKDALGMPSRLRGLARCLGATLIFAVLAASAQGQSGVTLAWDPDAGTNIAGYKIYYGVACRTYTNTTNVGNVTNATIPGLTNGCTYYIAATAYDTSGVESDYSTEVVFTNQAATLPTIVLTSPVSGSSYIAPSTISLSASVTANGHTITQVQFCNGATLLATVAAAPYSYSWNSVSAGTYSVSAKAVYDSGSTVASGSATLTVANLPPPSIALTSPVNGAVYTAPATIPLTASVTANGHTITKVQFYSGAALLAENTSAPYSNVWTNVSAGSYSLTARAVYDSGSTIDSAAGNVAVTSLPAPWQTADIGKVAVAGSAGISGGLYTVAGAGKISGSADGFRFLYQTMSGNGEIRACVSSVQNTGTGGCMGLMARESLTGGSEYALMGISPDGTFRWQRRSKTGGSTSSTTSGVGTPPNAWARLVRTNGIFYGYKSIDGTNWTQVSSRSINMATNIYVGLAVASGTSNVLNSSTFTNVTVVP